MIQTNSVQVVRISRGFMSRWFRQIFGPYLSAWIAKADPNSQFARHWWFSLLVHSPVWIKMILLRLLCYDGFVRLQDGKIINHLVFQVHGFRFWRSATLHMFSVATAKAFERQGLGTQAIVDFVIFAEGQKGIKAVRCSQGGDPRVASIFRKLSIQANQRLPFPSQPIFTEDFWIKFGPVRSFHKHRSASRH